MENLASAVSNQFESTNDLYLINTDYWYQDDDISSYVDLIVKKELGGYKACYNFLLQGIGDGCFPEHDELHRYFVAVTPSIDSIGLASPIDFYLNKTKQQAPDTGLPDDRRDVFDEIMPSILTTAETHSKILFPYNITLIHWLMGEIKIHQQNHTYIIEICAHDPKRIEKIDENNYQILCSTIEQRIRALDSQAQTIDFINKASSYQKPRQAQEDATSCGVILAEDLLKRITGDSLNQARPYPIGTKELRQKHIANMEKYLPNQDAAQKYLIERLMKKDNSLAYKSFAIALKLHGQDKETFDCRPVKIIQIEEHSKQAKQFYSEGKFDLAIEQYQKLIDFLAQVKTQQSNNNHNTSFPFLTNINAELGEHYQQLGCCYQLKALVETYEDTDILSAQAETSFAKAIQLNVSVESYCNYAQFLYQHGRFKTAIEQLEKVLQDEFVVDSQITYQLIDKPRLDKMLQNEFTQTSLIIKAKVLITYLLIKNYLAIDEKVKAEKLTQDFSQSISQKIDPIAHRLLVNCYETLGQEQATQDAKVKAELVTQEYALAEKIKTIQLKKSIEDYSPASYQTLAEYFLMLGDIYLHKQAYTKAAALNNFALAKAAALYNFALTIQKNKVKADTQITKKKLFDVVQQYLYQINANQILIPTFDQHQSEIKKYKVSLKKIHHNACNSLTEKFKNLSEKTNKNKKKKSKKTRKIFQAIAEEIKDLINIMLEDCYCVLGKPMCQYAIIGLGSLARDEMTPYSDFEWAILIEEGRDTEEVIRYFHNLTNLLHLKVINLGKTIIPAMAIESLNPACDKTDWEFFDDITPRGFAFDSLMQQACKIPHGKTNEKGEKIFELIQTPKKMAEYLSKDSQGEYWIDKEPHLITVLSNWTYIDGNEALIADYAKEVTNVLNQPHSENLSLRHYIVQQLIAKNKASFDPSLNKLSDEGRLFDAKKDLYRIPNLAIDELALYFGLVSLNNSWEKLNGLSNPKKMNDSILKSEAAERLKWVLSETMRFRLQTYLHYNKQQEHMNPLLKYFNLGDERLIANQFALHPTELHCITLIYQTLMPLHEAMQALANNNLSILKENDLYDTRPYTLGKIAARLCQYDAAKKYYKQALKELRNKAGENSFEIAIILSDLYLVYHSLGDAKQSLEVAEEAHGIYKNLLGDKNIAVVRCLNNMGIAFDELGDEKNALDHYQKASIIANNINEQHDLALSLSGIGIIYRKQYNFQKAQSYFQYALNIWQKMYGEQDFYVAYALNNLGAIHSSMGEDKKALDTYYKALAINQKLYGSAHPNVALSLGNIGVAHKDLGNEELALSYHKQSLSIWKNIYGTEHQLVATSFFRMGNVYLDSHKGELALKKYQGALNIWQKCFRKPHLDVARAYNGLGKALLELGRVRPALENFEKGLAVRQKLLDKYHPDVAHSLKNVGNVYLELGNATKALNYHQQACDILQRRFGENHPEIANCLDNIGHALQDLGDAKQALIEHKKALAILQASYGENHIKLATCLNNIGAAYHALGFTKEALEHHQKAHEIERNSYGDNHPEVALSLDNIGTIYKELNKFELALNLFKRALAILQPLYGEQHSEVARLFNNMGEVQHAMGNIQQALESHKRALSIRKVLYGEQHPAVALSINNIGGIYYSSTNLYKAIKYFKKALDIRQNFYEEYHSDIAQSLINIGMVFYRLADAELASYYFEKALAIRLKLYDTHNSRVILIKSYIQILQNHQSLYVKYLFQVSKLPSSPSLEQYLLGRFSFFNNPVFQFSQSYEKNGNDSNIEKINLPKLNIN